MEMLKINSRDNLINTYGATPTLPYDIEGKLVEKNGKDIKVQKTIDNKTVDYSLRLKHEVVGELGDNVKIDKENIISAKLEEKKEIPKDEESSRKTADILLELGLEYTEENIRMIEFLLKSGIRITKENVDSYKKSREYLNKIIDEIDFQSYIKLMDRGIDLEVESLQKVAEALEELKNERAPFSLRRFLRLEKGLTYKEAEDIAKEIYGQRMGKDVYDTIIALDKEKLPISKENINKIMEAMSKIHNLEEIKLESYVRVLNEEMDFNIDNLYKINNSYTLNSMEGGLVAKNFEEFTIEKETDINGLKEILGNLEIEESMENIWILREFIVNDMTMDKESYQKVISMKDAVRELIEILDLEEILILTNRGINPLEEDIYNILDELKKGHISENLVEPLEDRKVEEIMRDLEGLGSIEDRELLQLVKSGQDFNLKIIKEIITTNGEDDIIIENKTVNKTIHLSNIFNTLGESLNLDTVSLAIRRFNSINLENLYNVQRELNVTKELVSPVHKLEEGLIFQEYIKARNNLTTNMIKESIGEGKELEHMQLGELNDYIEKKNNRYEKNHRVLSEIKYIQGEEDKLVSLVMKNNLPMNLKELREINSFLRGRGNIAKVLESILNPRNLNYNDEFKEGIRLLQEKISQSIKKGDNNFKESYNELMNSLDRPNDSFNSSEKDRRKEQYIETIDKISRKDMVVQLPVEIGGEYKNLNLIIPDIHKGIDKNNMNFYISLDTDYLGRVNMEINVRGREVRIHMEEKGTTLSDNISILENDLDKLGYTTSVENRLVDI